MQLVKEIIAKVKGQEMQIKAIALKGLQEFTKALFITKFNVSNYINYIKFYTNLILVTLLIAIYTKRVIIQEKDIKLI